MNADRFRILIADDEPEFVSILGRVLRAEGYQVFTAGGGKEACETAEREQVHLLLVDLTMPDIGGLTVLKHAVERLPEARVIIMTAFATAETAVEAMKRGALDYLIKPFSLDELKLQIKRAFSETALGRENRALREQLARTDDRIVGEAPVLRQTVEMARRIASDASPVLIQGETGTGKELVARLLHRESPRRDGPFLAVNCGGIPESLLEREMFGNEKGAFTGADTAKPGLLEAASDGTLLLDEIAEMPAPLQVKLLRVIEGHEFLRLGGTKPVRVYTRFIAATNRNLKRRVAEEKFREDLYYRLNALTLDLPPLRERGADIVLLAEHFLERFASERDKPTRGLTDDAKGALRRYPWPGNVRELRNVIERAVVLSNNVTIDESDLRLAAPVAPSDDPVKGWTTLPLREARESFEQAYLARVLKECGGNISQTAARIGLDRRNLQLRIKKYQLKGTG